MNTASKITLKRRLHSAIYKSDGGGEVRVIKEYTATPRNLIKAVRDLADLIDLSRQAYGNIGCGASWIEIDGRPVEDWLLWDVTPESVRDFNRHSADRCGRRRTLTGEARRVLQEARQ